MRKHPLFWTGLATFGALLLLSLLFYKERVAFADGAFHLFFILKDQSVAIYHHRVPGVITQIVPWLFAEMGLPLKTVAMAYSASYYAFYLGVFALIARGLKNERMALAFLLSHTLIMAHSFYFMVSELHQGLALLFLYLAAWENFAARGRTPRYFLPLSLVAIPVVALAHPLMIFPFTFMTAFLLLTYPAQRRAGLGIGLLYLFVFALKTWVFKTPYDSQAFSALNNVVKYFPDYLSLPSFQDFLRLLWTDYYFLLPALAACALLYVRRRLFGKLFLMLAFFAGLSFLINIAYVRDAPKSYLENQYQLLAIFAALPLAYDLFPRIKKNWVKAALIGLIAAACLLRVYGAHTPYEKRLDWLRGFLAESASLERKKRILRADQVPVKKLVMTWGCSYETWLLSTLEQGETRSLLIEEKPGEFDKYIHLNKAFIAKWKAFDYADFDPRYFVFRDTSVYVKPE